MPYDSQPLKRDLFTAIPFPIASSTFHFRSQTFLPLPPPPPLSISLSPVSLILSLFMHCTRSNSLTLALYFPLIFCVRVFSVLNDFDGGLVTRSTETCEFFSLFSTIVQFQFDTNAIQFWCCCRFSHPYFLTLWIFSAALVPNSLSNAFSICAIRTKSGLKKWQKNYFKSYIIYSSVENDEAGKRDVYTFFSSCTPNFIVIDCDLACKRGKKIVR